MATKTLIRPRAVRVNRSDLRQKQRETLNQAKQNTVVVISASDPQDEKLLVDKKYFDELVKRMHSLVETLEIMADQKLFAKSSAPPRLCDEMPSAASCIRSRRFLGTTKRNRLVPLTIHFPSLRRFQLLPKDIYSRSISGESTDE